jgi:HEAT repeat protein
MSSLSTQTLALDSPDESERAYAAEDLGYCNEAQAVTSLLERLPHEPSAVVRDAICQALIRLDFDASIEGAVKLFASEDAQLRNLGVDVLRHKGERSIPFLQKALQQGDQDMRKFVLDVLSGIQAGGTSEIYAAALADQDLNVVITAVENIGKLQAKEFRSQIEDLLASDAHPMLVAACLEALAEVGNESSLTAMRRCFPDFTDLPAFVLTPCLKALAAFGGETEFAELAHMLPIRASDVWPAILGALISIHQRCIYRLHAPPELSEEVRAVLQAETQSEASPACRYQATRVLGFWAQRREVREFLVSCLDSAERLVRLGAAEALRMSGLPGMEALLVKHQLAEAELEVEPRRGP